MKRELAGETNHGIASKGRTEKQNIGKLEKVETFDSPPSNEILRRNADAYVFQHLCIEVRVVWPDCPI